MGPCLRILEIWSHLWPEIHSVYHGGLTLIEIHLPNPRFNKLKELSLSYFFFLNYKMFLPRALGWKQPKRTHALSFFWQLKPQKQEERALESMYGRKRDRRQHTKRFPTQKSDTGLMTGKFQQSSFPWGARGGSSSCLQQVLPEARQAIYFSTQPDLLSVREEPAQTTGALRTRGVKGHLKT